MNDMRGLVSPRKISEMTGLPVHQIRSAALRGQIPHKKTLAGWLRFEPVKALAAVAHLTAEFTADVPWGQIPLPERVERPYVAGASSEVLRCERFISMVRELGIEVTHDWPEDLRTARVEPEAVDVYLSPRCLAGIAAADLVVVLAPLSAGVTAGAWVEMGAALALRKPVLLIAAKTGPITFEALTHRIGATRPALAVLRARARKGGSK
jgi:hypothetical protein